MRKLLMAGVLALAALAALPDRSHAWGRDPYNHHGYQWLFSYAFRKHTWIHANGPLFNYGPYYLPGHVTMHIPQPIHGSYSPADPNLWNSGFGVQGSVLPAPAAGYAPHATPTYGPPQPYISSAPPVQPGPQVVPVDSRGMNPVRVVGR
jgi:hypothetical protein